MGWAGGSDLIINMWEEIREYINEDERAEALAIVIDKFTDYDWDCLNEIEDYFPEARDALLKYDPDYDFEEDY